MAQTQLSGNFQFKDSKPRAAVSADEPEESEAEELCRHVISQLRQGNNKAALEAANALQDLVAEMVYG